MRDPWPFAGRSAELCRARELRHGSGVVIAGASGVGKSRFAAEVAATETRQVVRVIASRATMTQPFGAWRHLFAGPVPDDPVRAVAGTDRPLVLVDDAHFLDPDGLALLHHLVHAKAASVLVTVCTDEPVPEAITSLWKDLGLARVDLRALSVQEVRDLLQTALAGPVESASVATLHHLGGGNAHYLRELVRGADFQRRGSVWRMTATPPPTPALLELIDTRIGGLDPLEEEALELVALGAPLGLAQLTGLLPVAAVESLEAKQVITVARDRRRVTVDVAHPLYGEAVRARLPLLRARRRYAQLAYAVEASGARRSDDRLRLPLWRLKRGEPGEPADLLAACRIAWEARDAALTIRLGRAALRAGGGAAAAIVLSEALDCAERFTESREVLLSAAGQPCTPQEHTRLVVRRAWNLDVGLLDPEGADLALEQGGDDPELEVTRLHLLALRGRVPYAVEEAGKLAQGPSVRALLTFCLPFLGRGRESLTALGRLFSGELDAADAAIGELRLHRRAHLTWRAEVLRLRGRVAEAARTCLDATALDGSRHLAATCQAELAICRALLGDATGASRALAIAERQATPVLDLCTYTMGPARTWTAVAKGELGRAADLATDRAERAREAGLTHLELVALHDLVRLGRADLAADRLSRLSHDGAWAPICAAQARALADGDGPGLERAAARFVRLGMDLFAAEAYAQAGQTHERNGKARRAALRAAELAARCQGARTPALALIDAPTLTTREWEVARLAAQGWPNRRIAEHLTLSARTVENHLHSVYGKLAVRSRADLTAFFDPW